MSIVLHGNFGRRHTCAGCGREFTPLAQNHILCEQCHRAARWVAAFKLQAALWREVIGVGQ